MPRASSSVVAPARFSAVRCPAYGLLGRFSVYLHAAHSHPPPAGKDFEFVFFADGAGNQRAGHHRAKALHGENAIDGQARNGA